MNIICPICGKENTQVFSDSVYHTHGYYCEDCKKDFGVDDGKNIQDHEEKLDDFFYQYQKDEITYRIAIKRIGDKVTLTPSLIENKMLTPFEEMDFTSIYEEFKKVLFEKMYILDWPKNLTGFVTGTNDESYKIQMKYSFSAYEDDCYTGTNQFPPYFKVLRDMFQKFFITE